MAHLLTTQDIKNERSRLLNSIEILPMSYRFTDAEKTALLEIYKVQLALYDTAIARNIEVCKNSTIIVSKKQLNEALENDFKIMLINGKPNTGKSTFAKTIAEKFNKVFYFDGNDRSHTFIIHEASEDIDLIIYEEVNSLRIIYSIICNFFSTNHQFKTPKLIIVADLDEMEYQSISEHLKSRILIINM